MELDVGHPILLEPGSGEVVGDTEDRRVEILCDREPADGGRPVTDAVVVPPGTRGVLVDRHEIRIEVRDEPGRASGRLTCLYALEDGRFLEIQAPAPTR